MATEEEMMKAWAWPEPQRAGGHPQVELREGDVPDCGGEEEGLETSRTGVS